MELFITKISKLGRIRSVESVKSVELVESVEPVKSVELVEEVGGEKQFPHSLNCEKILQYKKTNGSLPELGNTISNEELLELPVAILVPAAMENVINGKNMKKIKAKIIIEMANGPVSEEAYDYLTKKGTIIVPDVLANSGGVVVSYLEWYQNMHEETWTEQQVNDKLQVIMNTAFEDIWQTYKKRNHSLKQAAFETAMGRIIQKYDE